MRKLLPLIFIMLFASCRTAKQTTTTVTLYDTVRTHLVIYDTNVVQIADTLSIGKDIIPDDMYDSINNQLVVKDEYIQKLLWQLKHKQFNVDSIQTTSDYATAIAGVTNNELWVKLILDSLGYINTTTIDTTTISEQTTTTNTIVKEAKQSIWRNPWFYVCCLLGFLCVAFVIILLSIIIKEVDHNVP